MRVIHIYIGLGLGSFSSYTGCNLCWGTPQRGVVSDGRYYPKKLCRISRQSGDLYPPGEASRDGLVWRPNTRGEPLRRQPVAYSANEEEYPPGLKRVGQRTLPAR